MPKVVVKSSTDGTPRWTLTLTNISDHSCRTRGWVGLEIFEIRGKTATSVMLTVERTGTATDVVLRPYKRAYSILTRPATDDGSCAPQPILGVIPPGEPENHDLWPDFPDGAVCKGHIIATALLDDGQG